MKKYILFLFFVIPFYALSQNVPDVNAHSPKPEKESKVEKQARVKKEKRKANEEKAYKEFRKQNMKMQTKDVRKRMRQNRHKAKLINEKKREFFLVRWFRKKSAY
jgi:hypothetical protein